MQFVLKNDLPFITVLVTHKGKTVEVQNVLIDTGSGSTVFSADIVSTIDIKPQASDTLHTIHGVGGREVVFTRKVDVIKVGNQKISDIEIEISGMDYGFDINGILGMDFLTVAGAIINLREMKMDFSD